MSLHKKLVINAWGSTFGGMNCADVPESVTHNDTGDGLAG